MKSLTCGLLLMAICAFPVAPAAAGGGTTLYVDQGDPSCTDAGTGAPGRPFCTIGAAARAVAGQTVEVASGMYVENVTPSHSGTASVPIVFTAAPGASVTVGGKTHGFTLSGRSGITVQGFTVTGTTEAGISVTNSSDITLTDNRVSYSGRPFSGQNAKGIRLSAVMNALVARNRVDHNTDYGIYLLNSTGIRVLGNDSSYNARGFQRAASGIRLWDSPANAIAGNVCHHNEDSGIDFSGGADDNLIVNNVSYRNGDHGIDVFNSAGPWIVGNSVYGNVSAGINVEGVSGGARLANNISVDNGIASPRTTGNLRVDADSIAGTSLDHDLVFLHRGTVMMLWGPEGYGSLKAFSAATGQEQHGLQADPDWVAPDAGDFHLRPGSPAIDSANSGANGPDSDADGKPRVDDPVMPNTGIGPRTYDDRGAYEFQPDSTSTTTTTPTLQLPCRRAGAWCRAGSDCCSGRCRRRHGHHRKCGRHATSTARR